MAGVYLESSAAAKLVLWEAESGAVEQFLAGYAPLYASALVRVELGRAMLRRPAAVRREAADVVLAALFMVEMDRAVLERAALLPPAHLRSLDAIHLATALSIPGLNDMVVYDQRLAEAARSMGLRAWAPA